MTCISTFCFCLCLCFSLLDQSQCALLPEEFQVLHSLYNETNGQQWNYDNNDVTNGKEWDFSTKEDPCVDNWYGIVCNASLAECATMPCEIRSLILKSVGMTGSLPDTLSSFGSNFHTLSFSGNMLSSSIPSGIGILSGLQKLSLENNMLTGPIPASFAQLQNLQILDLNVNMLSKKLPLELCQAPFSELIVLYLGENQLSGPLPTLWNASKIKQIYVTKNSFTGTIPLSYYTFSDLFYLGLATNNLQGTLSSDIGNLKVLKNFYAGYNSLETTIPNEVGQLTLLEYFEITKNNLYGTIPSEFGLLTNLLVLELNVNSLTGTLPSEIGNLSLMHTLYLHFNNLHGPIPESYAKLVSLQLFILSSNAFTGTLSTAFSDLTNIYDFSVDDNQLSGLISGHMLLLPNLQKLLVQNNAFSGFEVNASVLQNIEETNLSVQYLDISNNRFHGTIPSNIFSKLNNIVSLSATKNCFTGSLPEAICESLALEVLAFDGLASGDGCRDQLFYPFSLWEAYLITPLEGSIPHCYWSMPNLTVLHLSGNGLGGSILADIPDGKLQNVSLSFNRLTGSIPRYLMEHHFVELSLSNNKFRGMFDTLYFKESSGAVNRSILDIKTNRLSGFVPLHICDVDELSAVEGNLFDCNHHHSLPSNDPYHEEYVCASKQLTQPILTCIVILSAFIILSLYALALLYRSAQSAEDELGSPPLFSWTDQFTTYLRNVIMWTSLQELENDLYSEKQTTLTIYAPNLKIFVSILRMLRKTFFILSVLLVIVCVPLYYIIKNSFDGYYSTHERQYTWTYSIAYMSGTASAVIIMTIFCLSCFFVTLALNVFVTDNHMAKFFEENDESGGKSDVKAGVENSASGIRNVPPAVLRATSEKDDDHDHDGNGSDEVAAAESEGVPSFAPRLRNRCCYGVVILCNIIVYSLINSGYIFLLLSATLDSSMKLLANFGMALVKLFWNLFVVPTSVEYTAQALGDNYHHLKWMIAFLLLFNNIAAPSLATAFTDDKCYEQLINPSCEINAFYELPVCNIYELDVSTGLRDCYEYITLSIETPFSAPFIYNYQCSSSIIVNYVPVFLFAYAFLTLMFPLLYCVFLFPGTYINLPQPLKDVVPTLLVPPSILHLAPQSPHVPVLRPDRIIATLMSHFAVLLTFGIASPILGCVIGVTVCVLTLMHQLIIGRYLAYHTTTKDAEMSVTYRGDIDGMLFSGGLEHACTQFLSGLPACLWTIIVGSNLLLSFIVFDSVGDKQGFRVAIWAASVNIVIIPLMVYLLYSIAMYERNHKSSSRQSSQGVDSLADSLFDDEADRPLLPATGIS